MSIYSPASGALPSPQDGQDSGRSPSVKSNHSVRKCSRQGSGLLPTPNCRDGDKGQRTMRTGVGQINLSGAINLRSSSQTSGPSTAPDSEEQPYLPGEFHASRRPSPGSEKERRMTVGSGRKLLESWPKSSQPGPSLKTLVESLVLNKAWYSRICYLRWRARATKSDRLLFQLAPSMPRTGEIGSGYLLTLNSPRTTPRSMNYLLKTPSSVETEGGVMEIRPGCDGHYKLRDQIAMLPTPNAFDARSENGWEMGSEGDRNKKEHTLPKAVGISRGLKLQPAFVEWMQGFPIGWTDLKHSETPLSRRSHTRSSRQSVRLKA